MKFNINLYENDQHTVQIIDLLNEIKKCRGGWCVTDCFIINELSWDFFLTGSFQVKSRCYIL